MSGAAVHEEHDCTRAIEGLWILRPPAARHHRENLRFLREHLHQERAPGEEFVLTGTMAWLACYQYDFDLPRIAWLRLQRNCRLVMWVSQLRTRGLDSQRAPEQRKQDLPGELSAHR